jgi:Sec-independent protein translocase protein TatA
MILDPAKLLLIGVVALLVLGPDKIPAAAKKISALIKDLQRMRASVQEEFHKALDDLPLSQEIRGAKDSFGRVTKVADPRRALYDAVGLSSASKGLGAPDSGEEATPIPGSIDLAHSTPSSTETKCPLPIESVGATTTSINFDPSQN